MMYVIILINIADNELQTQFNILPCEIFVVFFFARKIGKHANDTIKIIFAGFVIYN